MSRARSPSSRMKCSKTSPRPRKPWVTLVERCAARRPLTNLSNIWKRSCRPIPWMTRIAFRDAWLPRIFGSSAGAPWAEVASVLEDESRLGGIKFIWWSGLCSTRTSATTSGMKTQPTLSLKQKSIGSMTEWGLERLSTTRCWAGIPTSLSVHNNPGKAGSNLTFNIILAAHCHGFEIAGLPRRTYFRTLPDRRF